MSEQIRTLFFEMLRRELNSGAFSEEIDGSLGEEEAEELYALSCRFGLAHLVGDALKKSGIALPEKTEAKFRDKVDRALYRYCIMQREIDLIGALFEKEQIPYLPLKGAVLRSWYPEPWMRFSADIDILVHPEDTERATEALISELQYDGGKRGFHEISFMSKTNIHLELHFDLIEDGRANGASRILKTVWDHASHEDSTCRHTLDAPMFYFYQIAHMAKHFGGGLSPVQAFLDLWLLDQPLGQPLIQREEFQTEDCVALLKEGNLLKFAELSRKLAGVWLGGRESDEDTRELERFVLENSGGKQETARSARRNGRFRAVLTHIFLPYDVLKYKYPVLQKHRWLTPIMEVRRWGGLIFCGGMKRSIRTIRTTVHLSDEAIGEAKSLFEKLGL